MKKIATCTKNFNIRFMRDFIFLAGKRYEFDMISSYDKKTKIVRVFIGGWWCEIYEPVFHKYFKDVQQHRDKKLALIFD